MGRNVLRHTEIFKTILNLDRNDKSPEPTADLILPLINIVVRVDT